MPCPTAQCCNQECEMGPASGELDPCAWLGATHPGLLLRACLSQFLTSCPRCTANGARCCFGENTFWSLLSGPSQPHPRWRRCQDKWKISHKYLEKGKREKERRTNCLGALWGHLGDGHGQMRMAGHRHLSPCRRPQWSRQGRARFGLWALRALGSGRGQACLGRQRQPRSARGARVTVPHSA